MLSILKIDSRRASVALLILSLVISMVSIALHSPGHVSFDTSVQLYEAHIGQSISYHPPFMSALMKWLGGGEVATSIIVMICSLSIYLSIGIVIFSILRNQADSGNFKVELWRIVICALLILNPVIFVYVGIVWKDVLFASVLTAATALSFVAAEMSARRALPLVLISIVFLTIVMQVRQQGLFLAPMLILLPIVAIVVSRGWSFRWQALVTIVLMSFFLVSLLITQYFVSQSITGAGYKSTSEGFENIMDYDVAGIIATTQTKTELLPISISKEQRIAVSNAYSAFRSDYLGLDSVASEYLYSIAKQRKEIWLSLIYAEPKAFIKHKIFAFESLLNFHGITNCLPTHVGVTGNHDYLNLVGIAETSDARDEMLYKIANKFFDWPIYRHWFYLIILLVTFIAVAINTLPTRLKLMGNISAIAIGLFYLSYLPTTIACDFRYLFAGIPLTTILLIVVLLGKVAPKPLSS